MTDAELRTQVELLANRWLLANDEQKGFDNHRLLAFSDNLCIGAPFESEDPALVERLLKAVAGFQFATTVHERFLRGGLVAGPLYMDERIVDGRGLVRAVDLEHNVAAVPRVVLSDEVSDLVRRASQEEPGVHALRWNRLLAVDSDGRTFVHYLAKYERDVDCTYLNNDLEMHRDSVVAGLIRFSAEQPDPAVFRKYVWAGEYHNWTCSQVRPQDTKLLINGHLPNRVAHHPRVFRPFVEAAPFEP